MANTPQSIKRARQATKRQKANKSLRTRFRAVVRRARAAIGTDAAASSFATMQSVADHAARKGIVHRRAVARLKSRIVAAAKKDGQNPQPKQAAAKAEAAQPRRKPSQAKAEAAEATEVKAEAAEAAAPKAEAKTEEAKAEAPQAATDGATENKSE